MLDSKGLNKSKEEAVLLQMGIISEKDIQNHDSDVSVVPAPSPAPVTIKQKVENNDAASIVDSVVVDTTSS